jgi:putative DNA primase/helicase
MSADAFLAALAGAGLPMVKADVIGDGRLHRYLVLGDKAGSLNGWYVLHLDGMPFGAFGSWKTGQSLTWTPTRSETPTPAERAALAARLAEVRRLRDAEQVSVQAAAAARAAALWRRSKPIIPISPGKAYGPAAYVCRALPWRFR